MMTWTDKLQTMRQAYKDIRSGEEPWVALGNFSNDFFDEPEERAALVAEPLDEEDMVGTPLPQEDTQIHEGDLHQWAVFCAASVEYLCGKYDLPIPTWIDDPAYAPLAQPWHHIPAMSPVSRHQIIRAHLEAETPDVFKRRNIFCGDRIYLNKREEAEKLRRLMFAS